MAVNEKKLPIPVVPRMMRIVNPDGTLTRSGQLLLEQVQTQILSDIGDGGDGGSGGGDGTPDATGPVTAITLAHETGPRRVDEFDRLVHLTVGFIPVVPTPQSVTYLISSDDAATWVWVGSQRMLTAGQELLVDRLAPGQTETWRVAAAAGNLGGDPNPIDNADLDALYPGVVRSRPFTVLRLTTPPANQGITTTIGACTNHVTSDGLTQYGVIPGVIYTDPIGGTDFFVRITVENLDASKNSLAPEQAYGGTQITGGTHTEADLKLTYIPGLAFMRYRFYTANRNSQGSGDFTDPTTNTLQMVVYNGGAPADHYDVPITIPPFTPIDPTETFNVLSVTGSEVGPKSQDEKAGLHTVVGIIPVIDADYSSPRTVTLWLDFADGKGPIWQGWYALKIAGQVVRIGDSHLGTDGVRKAGDIWVPANTAQGNWKVYCGPGRIDKGISATAYPFGAFTVVPVGPCSPTGTTQAHFVNTPATGDPINYSLYYPGIWRWEYYELTWIPPTLAQEPDYWFTMVTIQKGATIGGVWTPAPDPEGVNEDPTGKWIGRAHVEVMQLPGIANDQTAVMQKFGANPATWVIPPAQNSDGSTNVYR